MNIELDSGTVRPFRHFGRPQTEEPADPSSGLKDARIRQVANAEPGQAAPHGTNQVRSGEECVQPRPPERLPLTVVDELAYSWPRSTQGWSSFSH